MKDLHNKLRKYANNRSLQDAVVDCVYVMLCRKVLFGDIHVLSNKQLISSYQGFKSAAVYCLLDPCSEVSSPADQQRASTSILISEL